MALMAVALVVVFFAASGFVLTNISNGTEVRADRVTPAVQLAQRTADTLARSRQDGCRKRGDRCREAKEREALADLASARAEAKVTADPRAQATHLDSNIVRTAQAAAMVLICLCSGYLIAFGAGLIWPRSASARRAA
jgi:hypothetical protein